MRRNDLAIARVAENRWVTTTPVLGTRGVGPREGVGGDVGERPPHRPAVVEHRVEHDVAALPTGDERADRSLHGTDPGRSPTAHRRVGEAQAGAVLVRLGTCVTLPTPRHDPDVLDGSSLQHPGEVPLPVERAGHPVAVVPGDHEVPATDERLEDPIVRCQIRVGAVAHEHVEHVHRSSAARSAPGGGGSRCACWSGCARAGRRARRARRGRGAPRTRAASPGGPGWRRGRSGCRGRR